VKNILLVEDDSFFVDIYTTKLKEANFSVEVAGNGEEALRKIKEKVPDLVLLDIVLPYIDGWEILEKIKNEKLKTELPSIKTRGKKRTKFSSPMKNESLENLKIVVLSNLGQKEEIEKGLELGATKYLIKAQYTPSQVVEEIKSLF